MGVPLKRPISGLSNHPTLFSVQCARCCVFHREYCYYLVNFHFSTSTCSRLTALCPVFSIGIAPNLLSPRCCFFFVGRLHSSGLGENIAMSGSRDSTVPGTNYTQWGWFNEENFWTYPSVCQSGKVCGHWTQIIWNTTTSIGCGVSSCPYIMGAAYPSGLYIVCNYGPGGNYPRAPFERSANAPSNDAAGNHQLGFAFIAFCTFLASVLL